MFLIPVFIMVPAYFTTQLDLYHASVWYLSLQLGQKLGPHTLLFVFNLWYQHRNMQYMLNKCVLTH